MNIDIDNCRGQSYRAIKNHSTQKALVKDETARLLDRSNSLESAIFSEFWESIFNIVSKILQSVDTDVEVVSKFTHRFSRK